MHTLLRDYPRGFPQLTPLVLKLIWKQGNGVIVEILYCILRLSTGMLYYFVSCDKEIVLIKNKPKLKTHPGLPFSLHSSAGISSA